MRALAVKPRGLSEPNTLVHSSKGWQGDAFRRHDEADGLDLNRHVEVIRARSCRLRLRRPFDHCPPDEASLAGRRCRDRLDQPRRAAVRSPVFSADAQHNRNLEKTRHEQNRRVVLKDDESTRYYIDPQSGVLLQRTGATARWYRWLFGGLHRIDFTASMRARPAWDIIMLTLMLGGLALTGTGFYLALRRIRNDIVLLSRFITRRKPAFAEKSEPAGLDGPSDDRIGVPTI